MKKIFITIFVLFFAFCVLNIKLKNHNVVHAENITNDWELTENDKITINRLNKSYYDENNSVSLFWNLGYNNFIDMGFELYYELNTYNLIFISRDYDTSITLSNANYTEQITIPLKTDVNYEFYVRNIQQPINQRILMFLLNNTGNVSIEHNIMNEYENNYNSYKYGLIITLTNNLSKIYYSNNNSYTLSNSLTDFENVYYTYKTYVDGEEQKHQYYSYFRLTQNQFRVGDYDYYIDLFNFTNEYSKIEICIMFGNFNNENNERNIFLKGIINNLNQPYNVENLETFGDLNSFFSNFGYDVGFDGGYDIGFDGGYDIGFSEGRAEGYTVGYNVGYNVGLETNINDTTTFNAFRVFFDNIWAVINVKILGFISLGDILLFMVILGVIGLIIKSTGGA